MLIDACFSCFSKPLKGVYAMTKKLRTGVKQVNVDAPPVPPSAIPESSPDTGKHIDADSGKLIAGAPSVENDNVPIPAELIGMSVAFKSTFKDVPFKDIWMDDSELLANKRDEKKAYTETNADMKRDLLILRSTGMMPGFRVLLHRNTLEHQGNTHLVVVRGFRRYHLCKMCNYTHIPAEIITGATNAQLSRMRIDPKTVDEDRYGKFKKFRDLMNAGVTNKKDICAGAGIPETDHQEFKALYKLPQAYQDIWIARQRGEVVPFVPDRNRTIALAAAQKRDQTACDDNGVVIPGAVACWDGEGPEYKAQFAKYVANPTLSPAKVNAAALNDFADGQSAVPLVQAFVRGLAHAEGIDREKAVKDITLTAINYAALTALASKVKSRYFDALVFGPSASNDVERVERHRKLAELFVSAIEHYIGVNGDSVDVLAQWERTDTAPTPTPTPTASEPAAKPTASEPAAKPTAKPTAKPARVR